MKNKFLKNSGAHYDSVINAWRLFMGEHLHAGYYDPFTEKKNLKEATEGLISLIAKKIDFSENSFILDNGCGTGETAIFLHKLSKSSIYGITNSYEGYKIANQKKNSEKIGERVKFFYGNALDNKFFDEIFDVSLLVEISHLIKNKNKLIKENFRVMKTGGRIVICEFFLKKKSSIKNLFNQKLKENIRKISNMLLLNKFFCIAGVKTKQYYISILRRVGFKEIEIIDITSDIRYTFQQWEKNIYLQKSRFIDFYGEKFVYEAIDVCNILYQYFKPDGPLEYAIIIATKK